MWSFLAWKGIGKEINFLNNGISDDFRFAPTLNEVCCKQQETCEGVFSVIGIEMQKREALKIKSKGTFYKIVKAERFGFGIADIYLSILTKK